MGDQVSLDYSLLGNSGTDYSGSGLTATAVGVPSGIDPNTLLPGDVYDAQQMSAYTPAPAAATGMPWWAGLVGYGVTKAIDNQFPGSPSGLMGNVYPGSMAGANGATFTLGGLAAGGGATRTAPAKVGVTMGMSPLMLIGGLALVYILARG